MDGCKSATVSNGAAVVAKRDAWGGGGLFNNERTIGLNHPKSHMNLAAEFALPKSICVEPSGIYAGRGEDNPILSQRRLRDGWKLRQAPAGWENKPKSRIWHEFTKKAIWAKSRSPHRPPPDTHAPTDPVGPRSTPRDP